MTAGERFDSNGVCQTALVSKADVLLCTSNGVGLGHLTRTIAIARHLQARGVVPKILTLSDGVGLGEAYGVEVSYFPHRAGQNAITWNLKLASRVRSELRVTGARAITFDGTWPYRGFQLALRLRRKAVTAVWVRRAMWKPSMDAGLQASQLFDFIIEPGDYAAAEDKGATVTDRNRTHQVAPIRLVQPADLVDRSDARRRLGLDPDRLTVLVQLGRGVIGDFDAFAALVAQALPDDTQIVLAARQSSIRVPQAISVDTYPLAASFSAFDCAISAAGYNTFHESLSLGLPSLFVPNTQTRTDDQEARARWAERAGVALAALPSDEPAQRKKLALLASDEQRTALRAAMQSLPAASGAEEAAALIADAL